MKMFIVLAALVAVALAAPIDDAQSAVVLKSESDVRPDGYEFAFETSDGVSRSESGVLNNVGTKEEAIAVRGTISYVGDDGLTYTLNYVADENGFQPEGEHLPKTNFA